MYRCRIPIPVLTWLWHLALLAIQTHGAGTRLEGIEDARAAQIPPDVLKCADGLISTDTGDDGGTDGRAAGSADTFLYNEGLLVFLQFSKVGSSTMRRLLGYSTCASVRCDAAAKTTCAYLIYTHTTHCVPRRQCFLRLLLLLCKSQSPALFASTTHLHPPSDWGPPPPNRR